MDKHLYNWLDVVEGKKSGTTIRNIKKEIARQTNQETLVADAGTREWASEHPNLVD